MAQNSKKISGPVALFQIREIHDKELDGVHPSNLQAFQHNLLHTIKCTAHHGPLTSKQRSSRIPPCLLQVPNFQRRFPNLATDDMLADLDVAAIDMGSFFNGHDRDSRISKS